MFHTVLYVFILLLGLALFLRISGTDTNCIVRSISGLLDAAKGEFTSRAGKIGKANLILSAMLLAFSGLLCIPDVLEEIRAFATGVPENNNFRIVLFVGLIVFFVISVCLVKSNEEFLKKMDR